MTEEKQDKREALKRVQRTRKLMEAGKQLRDYRDRIDNIITVINSGQDFHSDIADDIVKIGVNIQSLTKLIRPLSVEGQEKKAKRNLKRRWQRMKEKMSETLPKDEYLEWLKTYSVTMHHWTGDNYMGPNDEFFEDYVESKKSNT